MEETKLNFASPFQSEKHPTNQPHAKTKTAQITTETTF